MRAGATVVAPRLVLVRSGVDRQREAFAADVCAGLTASPKRLDCRYFYDRDGSRLFEEICDLPEYYLTRAEHAILTTHADEIAGAMPGGTTLVELGSGSAVKTRLLIDALRRAHGGVRYVPIDISSDALEDSAHALLADYDELEIVGVAGEYADGLAVLAADVPSPRLVLWLGSNIGNLHRPDAAAFLRSVRRLLGPSDRMLCGIDLRKDRSVLEHAYDDAAGVTARFNLNILTRVNRELHADFDLSAFRHRAVYDDGIGRVSMYLVSRRAQRVHVRDLDLHVSFARDEAVHTEDSYKYSRDEIDTLAVSVAFRVERRWLDAAGRFSVTLMAPSDDREQRP